MKTLFSVMLLLSHISIYANDVNPGTCTLKEFPFNQKKAVLAAKKFIPTVTAGSRSKIIGYDFNNPEVCSFIGQDHNKKPRDLILVRFHAIKSAPLHIIMHATRSGFSLIDGGFTLTPSNTLVEWRRKADTDEN